MKIDREMRALQVLEAYLKAACPYDTGNLLSSIRIVQRQKTFGVIIGGEIADYAVYTNEAWTADRWRGRRNPNEGWIDDTINEALPAIRQIMSGAMTKAEYNSIIERQEKIVKATRENRIRQIKGESI